MGKEQEDEVRSLGFKHVFTWSDPPNAHYAPHSHDGRTYHLITKGEMTVWFPNEKDTSKKVFGVGSRCDVEPGRVHEVTIGDEGCTMVIGE